MGLLVCLASLSMDSWGFQGLVWTTKRATQAKDGFSLSKLTRYFCLVGVIENFRRKTNPVVALYATVA